MSEEIGKKPAGPNGESMQGYDAEGKYTSTDADGFSSYRVETSLKEDKTLLSAMLSMGKMNKKQFNKIMSLTPAKRKEILDKVRDQLETNASQMEASRDYPLVNPEDFQVLAVSHLATLQSKYPEEYQELLNSFYHGYQGAGQQCFEFLKCWRMGWDNYQYMINNTPNYEYAVYAPRNKEAFEKQVKNLTTLSESCKTPMSFATRRFVDLNWLVSFMGKDWCSKIGPIVKDQYGYDTFDPSVKVEDVLKALQDKLAETPRIMRKPDDAVSSISIVEKPEDTKTGSHMVHHNDALGTQNQYKSILVRYDVPAGTTMFITNYKRESEALLKPGQAMFVKSVEPENVTLNDGSKAIRIVIHVGLVR